jgi:salicylate hydroxylase
MVTFAISRGREMFVFATKEEPEPARESWSAECDVNDLRTAFKDYHSEAQAALTACEVPLKTALYTRAPLGSWVNSRIALLGDAAHPMLPFMAQGAAMALEDAAVLARCVDHSSDVTEALQCYAATRMERANLIQRVSSENEWLRTATNAEWVYGFDAWSTALLMQTPDAEKTSLSISA